MTFSPGKYFPMGLAIILAVFLADQWSKWMVMETVLRATPGKAPVFLDWLTTPKKIEIFIDGHAAYKTIVLTPFFNLVGVWNRGISFGLFDSGSLVVATLFIALALVAALVLAMWLAIAKTKMVAIPLSLIAGGALANALDRIRFGAVADFIDIHAGPWHWPAFNLADSCIVLGATMLMIGSFIHEGKHVNKR